MRKPLIIGESNPYGGDDFYALYPSPDGCSGHRLCHLILGMGEDAYLDSFERRNLIRGKWSVPKAREAADAIVLVDDCPRLILCGVKVSAAFGVPFVPFEISEGGTILVMPHPSGLNRAWSKPGAVTAARTALKTFLPELAHLMTGPIKERTC